MRLFFCHAPPPPLNSTGCWARPGKYDGMARAWTMLARMWYSLAVTAPRATRWVTSHCPTPLWLLFWLYPFLVSAVLDISREHKAAAPRLLWQVSGHQRDQGQAGHGGVRHELHTPAVAHGELRQQQIVRILLCEGQPAAGHVAELASWRRLSSSSSKMEKEMESLVFS